MKLIVLIHIFIVLAVLSGCIGVNLTGEQTGQTNDQEKNDSSSSAVNTENPETQDDLAPETFIGDTVDLLPYVVFKVSNSVQQDLSGVWADLAAGETRKTFSSVALSLASETGLLIKLPTNITNNSLYVTLKNSGNSITETHLIPLVNCGENNSNCNKVVVEINNSKYQELMK